MEEWPDYTPPADMKEGVNYEVDYDNRRNFIEEKETKVDDEDENSIKNEDKEENVTTGSESDNIAKNDDNFDKICEVQWRTMKEVSRILLQLKKQKLLQDQVHNM